MVKYELFTKSSIIRGLKSKQIFTHCFKLHGFLSLLGLWGFCYYIATQLASRTDVYVTQISNIRIARFHLEQDWQA